MLEKLSPTIVWKYFEEFCNIPHPSGHEKEAAAYILNCAQKLGLPAITDSVGNVLIRKKPTDAAHTTKIILQSHLDMVPQKNAATVHDFLTDPIKLLINNEWVKAQGTTLGADNGIGVAIALAILESSDIRHGPIEALFTLDEERGMTGAFGLSSDFLSGGMLINLDTEEEDEICIGCAGGTDITSLYRLTRQPCPSDYSLLNVSLKGLQGGHSGMEIHLGRANALKLMGTFLKELSETIPIRIVDLNGGSARNAIPREAFCTISVPSSDIDTVTRLHTAKFKTSITNKFNTTDPNLVFQCESVNESREVTSEKNTQDIINIITSCPNGVITMSATLKDTVQTSNNLAIIKTETNSIRIDCMLRSSVESDLQSFRNSISEIFSGVGSNVSFGSMYPGWQPVESSLLSTMKKAYSQIHGKMPSVVAVHAGLECGIIGSKYPGMEMISCGPTIRFAHSPDEQMSIPSVERFWRCIVTGLEMLH